MLCWLVWNLPSGLNFAFGVSVSVVMPTREYHVVTTTVLLRTMLSRTLAVRTPFVYLKAARSFSASAQVRHTKVTRCLCYTRVHTAPILYCSSVSPLQRHAKVAVLGAAGGIGQPMSLLLKQSPLISQLALYDIVGTPGVAADLSHIETAPQV